MLLTLNDSVTTATSTSNRGWLTLTLIAVIVIPVALRAVPTLRLPAIVICWATSHRYKVSPCDSDRCSTCGCYSSFGHATKATIFFGGRAHWAHQRRIRLRRQKASDLRHRQARLANAANRR